MPSDDLKNYATADTDFYGLLGITLESSQRELDRQWRKTALKYHPDKVGNDPIAKERFHLAQIGYDLLSDPAAKALYDNTRNARLQRKRQNELFEGKRRKMKDDLEARERGVKRAREEEEDDEQKLERELRRLAEDGKRRRKEREDALKRDLQEESDLAQSIQENHSPSGDAANNAIGCSEIDRTVKVRWPLNETGGSITEHNIMSLFSTFGKIDSVTMLRPKELRLGGKKKKQLVAICMIQFTSVVGAHSAVEDFSKESGLGWDNLDSVSWAANKEPDFISACSTSTASSPWTPAKSPSSAAFLESGSRPSTPLPSNGATNDGLKKMPSFSSFSSAAFNTPKSSPFGKSQGVNSPSLEELMMIRLKNAEKKRLAEEIQRQDEEAAAAADVAKA